MHFWSNDICDFSDFKCHICRFSRVLIDFLNNFLVFDVQQQMFTAQSGDRQVHPPPPSDLSYPARRGKSADPARALRANVIFIIRLD